MYVYDPVPTVVGNFFASNWVVSTQRTIQCGDPGDRDRDREREREREREK